MADFFASDVGRNIIGQGGLATITAYVDAQTVTVQILDPFPAGVLESGQWVIDGTPVTTLTPSAKDPAGTSITLTLGAAGWRAQDVGSYVSINGGLAKITAVDSDTVAHATIITVLAAVVAAPAYAWTLQQSMWGGIYGYPRCGTLMEQRLWLAGSTGFPQVLWGSVTGDPSDFTLGVDDTDAISAGLKTGDANPILHLGESDGLVLLTSSSVLSVRGGSDKAITPTNLQNKRVVRIGASTVAPEVVNKELMFAQRGDRKVRALSLNQYDGTQYNAPDLAVLSEHVTESGIVGIAYQAEPDPMLYCVRADGQIATLTCDRDQDVFAWSRQVTQGAFESACAVPTPDGVQVFVVVARTVGGTTTRYIEKFQAGLHTDAAITGTSAAGATVWGGLAHLEGLKVMAKGDGVYLGQFVVTGGQITVPRPAYAIEIGLPYVSTIKTLTPEFMAPTGSAQGHQLSIHEVKVRLRDTTGCTINLQEVGFRVLGEGVLDRTPPRFTGDKKAENLGWGDGAAQTLIQQNLPYDFHLLSVITKLSANEG